MISFELLASGIRGHASFRDFRGWKHLRGFYSALLRAVTLNRGLRRVLYPGVSVRVSYASRQMIAADFATIKKYDVPCLQLIRRWLTSKPDAICFDIGANHGQFSMVISRWQSAAQRRLFAFEPDPHNLQVLRENLHRNSCYGVEIVGKALAADCGCMTLYGASTTASLQPGEGARQVVEVESLDAFCARTQTIPDIVKIDVEGFELEVLRGAVEVLTRCRNTIKIICEMHTFMWPSQRLGDEILRLVSTCGLRVFDMLGNEIDQIKTYGHYIIAKRFD